MDSWTQRAVSLIAEHSRTGKRARPPVDLPGAPSMQAVACVGLASSYPAELERHLVLDDGSRVRVRPIRPDDETGLEDLYARLSAHSAYQRFFTLRRRLPSDWYHYFANVDYQRRLALVAERETPDGPQLIGVGRYEPTDEVGAAEIALVVEDGWQGRGLGETLLGQVLAAAEARGIRRFRAYVLADNHRMLRLLDRGAEVFERKLEDGVVELSFIRAGAGSR